MQLLSLSVQISVNEGMHMFMRKHFPEATHVTKQSMTQWGQGVSGSVGYRGIAGTNSPAAYTAKVSLLTILWNIKMFWIAFQEKK